MSIVRRIKISLLTNVPLSKKDNDLYLLLNHIIKNLKPMDLNYGLRFYNKQDHYEFYSMYGGMEDTLNVRNNFYSIVNNSKHYESDDAKELILYLFKKYFNLYYKEVWIETPF